MGEKVRLTGPTLKVLGVLMRAKEEVAGSDIARSTGLASGTLYPILFRLEEAGWLSSRWEHEEPSELQRPRRRLYLVTALGRREATAAVQEVRSAIGGLAWT